MALTKVTEDVLTPLPKFSTIQVSHDVSVTGTQAVTGCGFAPQAALLFTDIGSTVAMSWGFGTSGANGAVNGETGGMAQNNPAGTDQNVNIGNPIFLSTSGGNYANASITSYDADGITLTWSKTGSPTGTASIYILFFGY